MLEANPCLSTALPALLLFHHLLLSRPLHLLLLMPDPSPLLLLPLLLQELPGGVGLGHEPQRSRGVGRAAPHSHHGLEG